MKTKIIFRFFLLFAAIAPFARGESAEAWTSAIRLDLRPSPRAASIGEAETLVFGDHWDGLGGDAVRIRLDGAEFATGTGEGTVAWTPSGAGFFTFEHTTLSGGAAVGDPLTASFYVGSLVPQNLRASDGTSPDHVLVEWNAITGTGYELFRATTNEFTHAVSIGTTNEPAWLDTTATPGETYWYWVRSLAGTLVSEPSASDDGWRATQDAVVGVWKEWEDDNNVAGYRPDSVSFTLYDGESAVATTNLTAENGWIAVWSVPGWRNGERIAYSVSEDDVPRAYETSVATNGLDTLRRAKIDGDAWTEDGWQTLRHLNLNKLVWTTNGWETLRHANLNTLVQVADRSRGTLFAVTNRFVAPTEPVVFSAEGWSGPYDGADHGISVTGSAPGFAVRYGTSPTGPFAADAPAWRDAGGPHEVWFVASAPYFVPVTNSATVTITPRPLTVTADAKTKVYGTADPVFTWSISEGSLVDGDAISGSPARAPGENVGTYEIGQGTLTAGPNYALSFTGADFTITPAKVTIRADAKTKVFGTADPALTYTVEGLAPGDDESSVEAVLLRAPGEAVGSYDIFADDVFFDSNYTYEFVGARLTITPATIVIDGGLSGTNSPASYVGVYDGEGHGISVAVTTPATGATVKYALSADGPFGATGPLFTNVTDHAAVWYTVEAANYAAATNWATVTITNRPLWVVADPKTKVFGTADPPLTYAVSNLVAGETLSGALVRDAGEAVGTYAIRQGTLTGGPNYTDFYTGADFTITPATIVVDGGLAGTNNPASYVGVYDGEEHGISVAVTAPATGATVKFALSADGPFGGTNPLFRNVVDHAPVWYTVEAPNYATATNWATVTITPAKVTIRAHDKTKVYGRADPELTYSVEGLAASDDESSVEAVLLRAPGEAVGSYDIFADDVFFDSNYTYEFVGARLTITKGTIPDIDKIKWSASGEGATFLYDGAAHGVALTGLPAGVTATYAGNVATNAGSYTATAHLVYDTANYEAVPDPEPIAWSISKRPITLMAASKEKPYDGWPLEVKPEDITVAGSGYAPGECFAYGDYASITDVGEIPATFSYADSATAKVSNYDVTVQGGQTLKITVGGDQISVTADSAVWAYDGETHRKESWTFVNGDKLLDGHVFDIAISADSAVTTPSEGVVSNRFDHVKIVEESSGRDMTRNYNLFVYEGALQVTNAAVPGGAIAGAGGVSKVYDGLPASPDVSATLLKPATVRYRVGDGDWTAEAPSWTHAGTYTAEFEVSAQFYDPATGTVQVAISPRPVTLSSPTKSKPYDGTALTFAADEIAATPGGSLGELAPPFPSGEGFVYSDFASITDAGRIDAAFAWAAGAGTLAADYDVTVEKGALTVTKNAEEISVTAKSATWVYDGETHTLHEWTAENLGALVAGDALVVSFDPASAITEPGEATNRIVSVKVMRGEADVTANYTVTWWPGTLKVTKAEIGPKMPGISTSATAVYDGAGHAATVAAPELLTAPVTVRYAATADGPWAAEPVSFTDAGAWTAFFRVEAPHYEPYVGTSTMTISPREVTLVSSGATKVYDGTPLRKDAVSVKEGSLPFADGEGFSATCSGTITDVGGVENVFEYALDANTKADNYTIRKEYGWLRVTPASIDVGTIGDGASWRGVYDGEGHGINVVAPVPQAVVTYALEAGNEEAYGAANPQWTNVSTHVVYFKILAPNYEPGYGSATVEIAKRTATVKADAKSKVYGDEDPELTYSVSNLVEGDSVSGSLSREPGEAEGTYRILQGTLSAGSNYEIAFTGANFKITKRNVSVRPASWTKTYGEPDPEFTAEVTGLADGDTATVVFSRTEGEDAGEYEIRIDRVEFSGGNYRVSVKTAKLTIVPRPATVRAVDDSKVFGAADPALEWESEDLLGDDTLAGTPSRDPGEAVGEYAIRIGSLTNSNYAVSFVEGVFEILPGGIVVDASAGAMGYSGEYDGAAHGAALRVKNPATGATVQWSATADGPWANASPTFVDAGTNTVWWRVTAPNFDPLAGTAQIAIAPRPISKASVGVLTNEYYTGYPVEPVPSVTDTVPITTDDWTVAWGDNVEVGHARTIVTGRGNYCGEVVREFEIVLKPVIVIVIDLSNVEVGQGKWGSAALLTNSVPVPEVQPGTRTEIKVPSGTDIDLTFTPDAGFKIGSVIVDNRIWSTNAVWRYEAAKADKSFSASYIPNPQTTVRWKLAAATGHYHAQLAFPVYPGYEEALANLKFHFADRVQNGNTYAQLWDYTVPTTAGRHVADEETLDGKKYRFVPLDPSKMAGLSAGTRVIYGVTDATLATTTDSVPQAQRLIGLYILKRISPVSGLETDAGVENFIGAFSWETNGKTYYQPVGEGYENGIIAEKILDPEDLDAAEALGFDPAFLATAEAKCRFTAFSPKDGMDGWFEIYAETPDGVEAVSTGTTENAVFHLWGTERLGGAWCELGRATFPEKNGGSVRFREASTDLGDSQFFCVTIEVKATHE